MFDQSDAFEHVSAATDPLAEIALVFTHPDDVVRSQRLTTAEKRTLLAAWASDAHAVPNLPAMRQLDSGAIVPIDAVLAALRALDEPRPAPIPLPAAWNPKSRLARLPVWRRRRGLSREENDDDPPPSPAAALPPGVELELRHRRDQAWGLPAAA